MKTLLTILMLCGVCCGYAQNTPPHAASTETWTVGKQTWSDAIHMPECNKETFELSLTAPQCRSYTTLLDMKYYYYNWPYVKASAAKLCPSPWRVPSYDDFKKLSDASKVYEREQAAVPEVFRKSFISVWGASRAGEMHRELTGYRYQSRYWSISHGTCPGPSTCAVMLHEFDSHYRFGYVEHIGSGLPVRCVKR
ncbi:MAG: fibrobacter succinogenes major paralogous domain-containing protein [Prevotellaceae bacterium]|jgi:uncharacterized protein (TIGR02145 family)|nr:fibrobacter succinogenes major paralogous domain-containing protein [Prevotellaceae bacterium]